MPAPDRRLVQLNLTADEAKLMLRLAEANDTGSVHGSGRLGGLRLRTSLLTKLYDVKDGLDGEPDDDTDDSED